MKRMLIAAVFAAGIAASSALGAGPELFPFHKDLTPALVPAGGIGAVLLDDEVLSELNESRTNLRLFDAAGKEVPFLLRARTTNRRVTQEKVFEAKTESLRELPDNRVEIVVSRTTNDPLPGAVVLANARQNFEKRVSVSGSDDRKRWTELASDQPIFDYSRYMDVRNNRIEIRPADFRFYRIEVSNVAEDRSTALKEIIRQVKGRDTAITEKETTQIRNELFRVERISFVEKKETVQEIEPMLRTLELAPDREEADAKKQTTIVYLSTKRQPLVSINLQPKELNFSRRVTVAGTDEGDPEKAKWADCGSVVLSRVQAGPIRQSQLKIQLQPPRRWRAYRLTIENQDNPPLTIEAIRAEAQLWEALFYQQDPLPQRLCYGGAKDQPARYDIGAVLASVPGKDAQAWSLGAQTANPAFRRPSRFGSWPGKYLMIAAMAAMVALLVWIIARTARKLEAVK